MAYAFRLYEGLKPGAVHCGSDTLTNSHAWRCSYKNQQITSYLHRTGAKDAPVPGGHDPSSIWAGCRIAAFAGSGVSASGIGRTRIPGLVRNPHAGCRRFVRAVHSGDTRQGRIYEISIPASPWTRDFHQPAVLRSACFPGRARPGVRRAVRQAAALTRRRYSTARPATPPCLHQAQAVTPVGSGAGRTGTVRASRIRRLKALGTHVESHPGDPFPERSASPATRTGQPESHGIQPKNQSNQIREITSIDGSQADARSVHFFVSVIRGTNRIPCI